MATYTTNYNLKKPADFFFAAAVSSLDLPGIWVHPGCDQPDAETVGHGPEQELGRSRNDQVVRLFLLQIPGFHMIGMTFPELIDNGLDIVQAVQEGKERLL